MKAFFDTSTFVKKYIFEEGYEKLDAILEDITTIIVAPIYLLEIRSVVQRKLKEKLLTAQQGDLIKQGIKNDHADFEQILWDGSLEQKALELIEKHQLKTLDSIQLASAFLSKADTFITSDQKLFQIAKKELKDVMLI